MRRFDYDGNDEYRDDIDNFLGEDYDDDDEYEDEEFGQEISLIEIAHANLASLDINRKILVSAIQVAEKSFMWRLWPMDWKLAAISKAYRILDNLIESVDEMEEE